MIKLPPFSIYVTEAMASKADDLLKQARSALKAGDNARATRLIKEILDQNFHHRETWSLLHKQYGARMNFEEFQRAFTEKYFPHQISKLTQKPEQPAGSAVDQEPARPRRSFLARLFGSLFNRKSDAFRDDTTDVQPSTQEAPQSSQLAPSIMANPPIGYHDPIGASPDSKSNDTNAQVKPSYSYPQSPLPVYSSRSTKLTKSSPITRFTPPFSSENKIRVVVVDDIAETRNNIVRSLSFQEEIVVVGTATTGLEGIRVAAEKQPDVVLMDVNMPDMDGITATAQLRQEVPTCEIIILTVQDDVDYMRKAMRAGARDFLTKPPMIEELTSAVMRAGTLAHEQRSKKAAAEAVETLVRAPAMGKGKILTVYSPKGGAGCTMLATNLALALNSEDTPVVLVDGDLQFGDVLAFFNEQSRMSLLDLTVRADELDPEIVTDVLVDHPSGLRILSAPRPENAESVRPEQFARVLDYLTGLFQYVVVDTGRRLSDPILAALDASSVVIVPVTQQIPSIANVRKFLDLAPLLNLDHHRVMVIMNQYDKRFNIEPAKISETFRVEIPVAIPFDEKIVIPSINRGKPFMQNGDASSRPIGRAMLDLVAAVRERINKISNEDNADERARQSASA